mmetsp:Transcript_11400/g.28878  ORF Transcript_11400/g.28878 Transcript_11400/m.28878 type:complete len:227 (-) Transcript_11400:1075-1755(-)
MSDHACARNCAGALTTSTLCSIEGKCLPPSSNASCRIRIALAPRIQPDSATPLRSTSTHTRPAGGTGAPNLPSASAWFAALRVERAASSKQRTAYLTRARSPSARTAVSTREMAPSLTIKRGLPAKSFLCLTKTTSFKTRRASALTSSTALSARLSDSSGSESTFHSQRQRQVALTAEAAAFTSLPLANRKRRSAVSSSNPLSSSPSSSPSPSLVPADSGAAALAS